MKIAEAIGAAGALLALSSALGASSYHVVDLGSLGGPSRALVITPSGWTAGVATDGVNIHHAFLHAPGGALTPISPLAPDNLSVAFAATDLGEAYGVSYTLGDPFPHAFKAMGGSVLGIGSFSPRGANEAGVVVGHMSVATATGLADHACMLAGGFLSELSGLGGENSYARAVNSSGRVAGMSYLTGNTAFHACVWQSGVAHDLGTLGGAGSQAYALNNANLAAGVANLASGDAHACVFALDASGAPIGITDLGTLGSARSSAARGVNDLGQVVGVSSARAFLSNPGGAMIDLNDRIAPGSGWTLVEMMSINNAGEMAGCGVFEGMPRAVLLIPCRGDSNGDFQVTFDDITVLLANFGLAVPPGEGGDANNDGHVDFDDVTHLLAWWSQGC